MIVLSGLLVLLSIILLLVGLLFSDGLTAVYFSIGTSIAAGVFLVLGALQRRGEAAPAATGTEPAADGYERVTAVTVTRPDETADLFGAGAGAGAAAEDTRPVSIVPGRPRYHTESCRFLAGRSDVTRIGVGAARAEGYSACGVCKPDAALTEAAPEPEPAEPVTAEETLQPAEDTEAAEPAAAPARKRAATKAPAKKAAATAATRTATKATAATAAKPAKATATKATATKTAAPAKAGASTVVVIPDRDKFHVETCRFVRDVPGTVSLSKVAAKRQGFVPCGVCKP